MPPMIGLLRPQVALPSVFIFIPSSEISLLAVMPMPSEPAVMEVAAWPVTYTLSGGFNGVDPKQFDFAVQLARLTFPYLLFISLVSLLGGILNSLHRLWVNAAAPILLNATLIAALLFFHDDLPLMTARNQAIAVTVSGALQLLWLWYACRRAGVTLRLKLPRLGPDVKRLMALML